MRADITYMPTQYPEGVRCKVCILEKPTHNFYTLVVSGQGKTQALALRKALKVLRSAVKAAENTSRKQRGKKFV